jgi:anti-anti-sigma factor
VALTTLGSPDHACLLYEADEERLESLDAIVGRGLAEGGRVLYLGAGGSLLDRLDADYVDRLGLRTSEESFLAGGAFDPEQLIAELREEVLRATADGYRSLLIVGETDWVTTGRPGCERLVEYERMLDDLLVTGTARAVCQYDRSRLDSQTILAATAIHPLLIHSPSGESHDVARELELEDLNGSGAFRLGGVVDVANVNLLSRRVELAVARGEDLVVDLSGLSFIDVTGLWVFYDAALRLQRQSKRVRLLSPPAPVEKVLEILGWHELDALEVG